METSNDSSPKKEGEEFQKTIREERTPFWIQERRRGALSQKSIQNGETSSKPKLEETIQEKETSSKPQLEETIQEEETSSKPKLEETIQEKETSSKPQLEETIQEEKIPSKPQLEETIQKREPPSKPQVQSSYLDLLKQTETKILEIETKVPGKAKEDFPQLKALLCGLKLCHDDLVTDLSDFIKQTNENFESFKYYISEIFSDINTSFRKSAEIEKNLENVHETTQAVVRQIAELGQRMDSLQKISKQIQEEGGDLSRDNEMSFKRLWALEKDIQSFKKKLTWLEETTTGMLTHIAGGDTSLTKYFQGQVSLENTNMVSQDKPTEETYPIPIKSGKKTMQECLSVPEINEVIVDERKPLPVPSGYKEKFCLEGDGEYQLPYIQEPVKSAGYKESKKFPKLFCLEGESGYTEETMESYLTSISKEKHTDKKSSNDYKKLFCLDGETNK